MAATSGRSPLQEFLPTPADMADMTGTTRPGTAGTKRPQPCSFEVDFTGNNKENKKTKKDLQVAFRQYKKRRQTELKTQQLMKERALRARADPARMAALRHKFLETAKKYYGVPYAKRYHHPDSPDYASPLFLDCCGLVRRVLRDLKADFGFSIGPWNQAYMYDTLPIVVEREEDMRPGDLVFVSGTYYNPKSKKQRHDMVHVEIWAGEGEKVVGARWQRGKVQMFNSYKFQSKSYHSMQYHFRSIDTWLLGVCKSYCPDHPWTRSTFVPSQRSVFAVEEPAQQDQEAEDADDHTQILSSHGNQGDATIEDVNVHVAQNSHTCSAGSKTIVDDVGHPDGTMYQPQMTSSADETAATNLVTASKMNEPSEEETPNEKLTGCAAEDISVPTRDSVASNIEGSNRFEDVSGSSLNVLSEKDKNSRDTTSHGNVVVCRQTRTEKHNLPHGYSRTKEQCAKDQDLKECEQKGSERESLPYRVWSLLRLALMSVLRLVY